MGTAALVLVFYQFIVFLLILPRLQFWIVFFGEGIFSHNAHDTSNPPAAGHDDAAGGAAALVVVRPGVVAHEGLADPLALGVASPALDAAHAQVIQHGVKGHAFTFQLLEWKVLNVTPVLSFSQNSRIHLCSC